MLFGHFSAKYFLVKICTFRHNAVAHLIDYSVVQTVLCALGNQKIHENHFIVVFALSRDSHSRILAWRIPWTEESGGLQSMGLQKVGHD